MAGRLRAFPLPVLPAARSQNPPLRPSLLLPSSAFRPLPRPFSTRSHTLPRAPTRSRAAPLPVLLPLPRPCRRDAPCVPSLKNAPLPEPPPPLPARRGQGGGKAAESSAKAFCAGCPQPARCPPQRAGGRSADAAAPATRQLPSREKIPGDELTAPGRPSTLEIMKSPRPATRPRAEKGGLFYDPSFYQALRHPAGRPRRQER